MGLKLDSEGGDQVLLARINHSFLANPGEDRRTQEEIRKGLERFADLFDLERRRGGSADCFSIAQVATLISDSPALFVSKTKVAAMGGGHTEGLRKHRVSSNSQGSYDLELLILLTQPSK